MGFKWNCTCGAINTYKGSKTTDANSTCSNCGKTMRIWKYREVTEVPTNSNNFQQKNVGIPTTTRVMVDLTLGNGFDRAVLRAGLNDTINIYKNKYLNEMGEITNKNDTGSKKVLEWIQLWDHEKAIPLMVSHANYFQKVLLAYEELKKLEWG